MITIERLDHLVLTVASIQATVDFYCRVLGMTRHTFHGGRTALRFGNQQINLHEAGHEFEPRARLPTPGSADLCFLSRASSNEIVTHLTLQNVIIELGPVAREGAVGPFSSVYFRDPDGNLVEIASLDS